MARRSPCPRWRGRWRGPGVSSRRSVMRRSWTWYGIRARRGPIPARSTCCCAAWCGGCIISCLISRIRTSVRCGRCRARTLSARAWRRATCSSGWAVRRSGSCPVTPPAWAIRGTGGEPRLTRLFRAFQARYGFDCSFRNPCSGHGKGAVESKVGRGAARAVRAPAERMEPGELQRRAAGPVPGAGHGTALPQGHGGTWPVLRGPCGAAAVAREAFRRGRVAAYEGRPVRRGHARGTASLFRCLWSNKRVRRHHQI